MIAPKRYQYPKDRKRAVYSRWMTINRRCEDPRSYDYPYYGAQGYSVAWEWSRQNPDGYTNFATWLEAQLKLQTNPQCRNVTLKPGEKVYSANNCTLATRQELVQDGGRTTLTQANVIALRALKKQEPKIRLTDIIERLGLDVSVPVVSNALRGITFQNLDHLEAPYLPEEVQQ
jgi:hypothetical protein